MSTTNSHSIIVYTLGIALLISVATATVIASPIKHQIEFSSILF